MTDTTLTDTEIDQWRRDALKERTDYGRSLEQDRILRLIDALAARVADRDTWWRERIEALAEVFDNENWRGWGIPQAIRALAAEARTQGGA